MQASTIAINVILNVIIVRFRIENIYLTKHFKNREDFRTKNIEMSLITLSYSFK